MLLDGAAFAVALEGASQRNASAQRSLEAPRRDGSEPAGEENGGGDWCRDGGASSVSKRTVFLSLVQS